MNRLEVKCRCAWTSPYDTISRDRILVVVLKIDCTEIHEIKFQQTKHGNKYSQRTAKTNEGGLGKLQACRTCQRFDRYD